MFIKSSACISPQATFAPSFREGNFEVLSGTKYMAKEPDYTDIIPRKLIRRMGKAVRLGVGTALPIIGDKQLDAIVIGTANGGMEGCIKFLNQIFEYNEGTLTPTNFVQSTPNSLAGLLALMTKNTGYNTTHVNKGLAFETALLDAWMLLKEGRANDLLIGAVEEMSEYNYNIDLLSDAFKKEKLDSAHLLNSQTPGSIYGEGASMFIASSDSSDAIAEVLEVEQVSHPEKTDLEELTRRMLERHQLTSEDIDTLMLGYSGDSRTDFWYDDFRGQFEESGVLTFKNIVGEHPTIISFGMWLTIQLMDGMRIPNEIVLKKNAESPNYVLIYNHYQGKQHGLVLIKKA